MEWEGGVCRTPSREANTVAPASRAGAGKDETGGVSLVGGVGADRGFYLGLGDAPSGVGDLARLEVGDGVLKSRR